MPQAHLPTLLSVLPHGVCSFTWAVTCFLFTDSDSGRKRTPFLRQIIINRSFYFFNFLFWNNFKLTEELEEENKELLYTLQSNSPLPLCHISLSAHTHKHVHIHKILFWTIWELFAASCRLSLSTSFFFPKNKDILYMTTDK